MTKKQKTDVYVAVDSGVWTAPDGSEYTFIADLTRVRAGHPLIKAMPNAFKPIDVHYDVEQATAGPGELRGEEVRSGV